MDVDLGYLPHGQRHRDTHFSNNLLQQFYPIVKPYIPSKSLFRKHFIEEKTRQWDIFKRTEKIEKSFKFIKSENLAGIGNRLDKDYIPTPNDGNVLNGIAIKLHSLLNETENILGEIKAHDQSLFVRNGQTLAREWHKIHTSSNLKFIASLSGNKSEMTTVLSRVEAAAKRFTTMCGKRSGYSKSVAVKKRKNERNNEKRKAKIFKTNVEQLASYLLTDEGQLMLNKGQVIIDSDIKVDRERPLEITAARARHLVHLLNTATFSHEARCTILDLVPDSLAKTLLEQMDGTDDTDSGSESDVDIAE